MNDILMLNKENLNCVIARLLTQGFYKDFILSKDLILDIVQFSKENNIHLSTQNIQRIKEKYDLNYNLFINNNNFNIIFSVKDKRQQLNLLNQLFNNKKFSALQLDNALANIVINYFKSNNIFIQYKYFNFLSDFNKG